MELYTVEWGKYENNKCTKVQTGDEELLAESKEAAIKKANVPLCEWCHVYKGSSKWL